MKKPPVHPRRPGDLRSRISHDLGLATGFIPLLFAQHVLMAAVAIPVRGHRC
jgi:hypothetical protein